MSFEKKAGLKEGGLEMNGRAITSVLGFVLYSPREAGGLQVAGGGSR